MISENVYACVLARDDSIKKISLYTEKIYFDIEEICFYLIFNERYKRGLA